MWMVVAAMSSLAGCDVEVADTSVESAQGPGRVLDDALKLSGSAAGELAGVAVAGRFDWNGDGQPDVAVGATLADTTSALAGRACLFLGPILSDRVLDDADLCLVGVTENHLFGRDTEGLADLDGDGFDELGLGAVHDHTGSPTSGMVMVVWGGSPLDQPETSIVHGVDAGGHLGLSIAPVPGPEPLFAAGAHGTVLNAESGCELRGEGIAWVVSPPERDAVVAVDEVGVPYRGERAGDRAGVSVLSPGDIDGDGLADLLIGASHARRAEDGPQVGAVYLVQAPFQVGQVGRSVADADGVLFGQSDRGWFGWATAVVGDVDGDGLADLATSAFADSTNGTDAGAVYVYLGTSLTPSGAGLPLGTLLGEVAGDKAGEVLSQVGDLDGDGQAELVVAAPTASHRRTWGGALYVIRGPVEGTRVLDDQDDLWVGTQDLQFLGASVAPAGESTLIVGAVGDTTNTGAAFVLGGLLP